MLRARLCHVVLMNACWCILTIFCLYLSCFNAVIDFGGATYDNDPSKSRIVNTRQYRSPEVTLELGWSFPSDVWSAGCIIAEVGKSVTRYTNHF